MPLSEIVKRINERFGTNISDTDRLFTDQVAHDLFHDDQVQIEAAANDETAFSVGFDKTWTKALTGRMGANEKFAFELLDNDALRATLVAEYMPDIYKRARVAWQRTCPISDLIGPDRPSGIVKRVGPHTLRHAFTTAALDAGVPLRDVQEAASHADPRTTMRFDRARVSLDRHATYIVSTFIAGASR